jgi:hypothetical protein
MPSVFDEFADDEKINFDEKNIIVDDEKERAR